MIIQSCVSDIVIEDNGSLPLVVECVLHKTETQTLKLYRMPSIYGKGELIPVEDAKVTIMGANKYEKEEAITFDRVDETNWSVDFEPQYGKLYRLQIITSDNDTLTAETRFPDDQRLFLTYKLLYDYNDPIFTFPYIQSTNYVMISCEVRDGNYKYYIGDVEDVPQGQYKDYKSPSKKSCKMWIFPHINATPYDKTVLNDSVYVNGEFRDPRSLDFLHYYAYDYKGAAYPYGNLISTDHPYVDNFNLTGGTASDLEWCKRPADKKRRQWGYSTPVRRYISANTGAWLRFFNVDFPLYDSFLRIDQPADFTRGKSDEDLLNSYLTTDRSFLLFADYCDSLHIGGIESCVHEVHFVSDEYDAYLRDLYSRKQSISNFILSVYDVKGIYSNIIGGKGIFGADNITWDVYDSYTNKQLQEITPIIIGEDSGPQEWYW